MKQIYVQAKPDHIESLAKSAPIAAVEELVWNALDADAKEVKVDLVANPLGAVEAVRVSDDGTGIDVPNADATFGSLGGSWKRLTNQTGVAHRMLHGRHGRGRFKAFALGTHVEWRTTTANGGALRSYVISGDISAPGVFDVEESAKPGPASGTEVYVSNARVNCDSLLNAAETVQTLASKFALYLKSYPDVRIYFNGLPVTPVIVQKRTTDYKITVMAENGDVRVYTVSIYCEKGYEDKMNCKYPVSDKKLISGLSFGTKAETFIKNLGLTDKMSCKLYSADGKEKEKGSLMMTGDKVTVYGAAGNTFFEGTVLLYGDVNGDGNLRMSDMIKVRNHILGSGKLKGTLLEAADCNHDGNIRMSDMIKIRNEILGTGTIAQTAK